VSTHTVTIGQDGPRVLLTLDGRTVSIPWEHADEIARALTVKARAAEEEQQALGIVADQALLLRVGVPLGLSDRPDIQAEAAHAAQYDRDLRRYLPGGVRSQETFGTPAVIRHAPARRTP
jgi:hypothetical protein